MDEMLIEAIRYLKKTRFAMCVLLLASLVVNIALIAFTVLH
jgi:hypothetical protein